MPPHTFRISLARWAGLCALAWGLMVPGAGPAWSAGPPRGPAPTPTVTVAKVIEKDVNPPLEFVGRVEAVQQVDLRARVQGYLQEVRFKEGGLVKAGDLLYVIEPDTYQAQVNVDLAKVAKAQATLTRAEKYLKRIETVRSGGVSATDLEKAVADNLQAKAEMQEAQANLEQARLSLGYTRIKAPIGGRIGRTAFTKGNLLSTDSGTLGTIVQVDPIRVVFSISENKLPQLQKNRPHPDQAAQADRERRLRLRLPGNEIYSQPGLLEFMDNKVDTSTGTIALRALFANPQGYLVPGQYVTVLDSSAQPKVKPVIPQTAVLEDREGRYVLVVDQKNQVVQRRITTGSTIGALWAVESGLTLGEMVIVQGVQKVKPGQTVKTNLEKQD